jgi:hypothetical protein
MTYDAGRGSSYTKGKYTSCNQTFYVFLHNMRWRFKLHIRITATILLTTDRNTRKLLSKSQNAHRGPSSPS